MKGSNLKILGRHTSYNVQKVLWLADELKLEYVHSEIGGRHGGNDSAEFLELNPLGKVPVLVDDKNSIWESHTIMRYLVECYADTAWQAHDPFEQSLSNRWLDWSIDCLEPAFVDVFWGYYRTPVAKRDMAKLSVDVDRCEAYLAILSDQLSTQNYLLGEHISLADIATGVFLHRLYQIDLEVTFPTNVKYWYDTLSSRPAYAKWVMSDFSELQGRLDY